MRGLVCSYPIFNGCEKASLKPADDYMGASHPCTPVRFDRHFSPLQHGSNTVTDWVPYITVLFTLGFVFMGVRSPKCMIT